MKYYYNPEIMLLLMNHSDKRVEVLYDFNKEAFQLPFIGPRPPYYTDPKYEAYYPII